VGAHDAQEPVSVLMLVDTDVLIWNLRGNETAADLLDGRPGFILSAVSYMELVQGLRDKAEFRMLRRALHGWQARVTQINEDISARARPFWSRSMH